MSKTAEAFRTISEVADELEVPKHVLRFWEGRFPQIRPMKRGGGRRYYRPEDMALLRGICHLLHAEGYTIKGVQKILREQGVDTVKRFGAGSGGREEPVEPRRVAAPAAAGTRRQEGGRRPRAGVPTKAEVRERLLAAIAELEACRGILLGKPPETAARRAAQKTRADPRARERHSNRRAVVRRPRAPPRRRCSRSSSARRGSVPPIARAPRPSPMRACATSGWRRTSRCAC